MATFVIKNIKDLYLIKKHHLKYKNLFRACTVLLSNHISLCDTVIFVDVELILYSTVCFLCFYIRHSHLSFLVWFFVRYCLCNFQFQFVFHTHNKVDPHHAQHALYISGHHTVFNCSGSDTHISPFYGVIIYSTTCCLICCSSLSPTLHIIPPPTTHITLTTFTITSLTFTKWFVQRQSELWKKLEYMPSKQWDLTVL